MQTNKNLPMEQRNIRQDVQPDAIDGFMTSTRAIGNGLLGAISPALVVISELIWSQITTPLAQRQNDWMIYFADSVYSLKAQFRDIDTEAFWKRKMAEPAFLSVFLEAQVIAVRTHHEKKLQALRNAVLNSALDSNIEDETQFRFLRLIEQFSPVNLDVLSFMARPREWIEKRNLSIPIGPHDEAAFMAIAQTVRGLPFYDVVVAELKTAQLIDQDAASAVLSGAPGGRGTGWQFEEYSKTPEEFAKRFDVNYTKEPLGELFYRFMSDPKP